MLIDLPRRILFVRWTELFTVVLWTIVVVWTEFFTTPYLKKSYAKKIQFKIQYRILWNITMNVVQKSTADCEIAWHRPFQSFPQNLTLNIFQITPHTVGVTKFFCNLPIHYQFTMTSFLYHLDSILVISAKPQTRDVLHLISITHLQFWLR